MAYKGPFKPRNPEKYKGDPTNIIYRSRWEVMEWSSEEVIIRYRSPVDNSIHRYFVDFYVKQRNKYGDIEVNLIEVKPFKQTKPPAVMEDKGKPTKRYINEVMTWGVNSAKWAAAREFCADRGWNFVIITEKELGLKF